MSAAEVVSAGTLTTVQALPGRLGLWEVGVPPSGPMDDRSLRTANRLVGNADESAGLEVTVTGPRLRFPDGARIAVTGAPLIVEVDGTPAPQWSAIDVPAGALVKLGVIRSVGMRAYLAVAGGVDTALAMGSQAVFAPAGLGGGALRKGDTLAFGEPGSAGSGEPEPPVPMGNAWNLRVVPGPHGAPDFLTPEGLEELFTAGWTVHHQSDRAGVRLTGPVPDWARSDGGDAGLHPSNILDSAYGVGTVMLAGDMAVVVGPDGPSLGGFVAIGQVVAEDRWQLGQVRAGDEVRLVAVDDHRRAIAGPGLSPLLDARGDSPGGPVTYRRAGEAALLVEFGESGLELRSRVRAHALQEALRTLRVPGLFDLTPGVRSLHIQHDPGLLPTRRLLDLVTDTEATLPLPETLEVSSRVITLPLAWRHSQAMLAVERYATSVRSDAPWCPDNIDFIRRINGLDSEEEVQQIVLAASYLVLGLGDVYLGAPVAVPLDPRHRLVTTKYNPARTWTPANAVGIGGAFLCVYGMEGPGGYQLVGRTVPVWLDRSEPPWLLRHFDQLRFELVEEAELEELRARSAAGTWEPVIEPASFSLLEHERFLAAHEPEIAEFRSQREAAFAQERAAWAAAGSR
ncbi:MAG: urea carboxylase [Solirubrobacteraceae bacterium]|nr:urea carboxylase [Solirubrobacteraceae bacterium]